MPNTDFVLGANIDFGAIYQAIGLLLEKLTSDPVTPATSQIWFRTDTVSIKYYDGTTVQTLAQLNDVVNSVTAADTTITVAGTATAVTVKVAKTLDHTYITDFDTQVRTSRLDQMAAPGGDVSWNNHLLTNLSDAVSAQDAVNLRTLQAYVNGLSDKASVYYATNAALPTNTYVNGASGVGATLTATANGILSVDGQVVQVNDPIMVNQEASALKNGLYLVTVVGTAGTPYVLTRRVDFDQAAEAVTGALVPVEVPAGRTAGTNNNNKIFVSVVATPAVIGTTAINFSLMGSTYSAGTGLTLTGTTFSLTTPVAIALGGTGATTAAGARTALAVPSQVYQTIGDGVSTAFVFTHNLNNSKPQAHVTRISDGATINCGVRRTSVNAVTVNVGTSGNPIGSNTHIITVTGLEGVG